MLTTRFIAGLISIANLTPLAGCATNAPTKAAAPAAIEPVSLKTPDEIAQDKFKAIRFADRQSMEFVVIATRKNLDGTLVERAFGTERDKGAGAIAMRVTLPEGSAEPIRYLNILELSAAHMDLTGNTPSTVTLRQDGTVLVVAPDVQLMECFPGTPCSERKGKPLGLIYRLSEQTIKNGKSIQSVRIQDANKGQWAPFMKGGEVLPDAQSLVVDIRVLRGSEGFAFYDATKGQLDKAKCEADEKSNQDILEKSRHRLAELQQIARQRRLTPEELVDMNGLPLFISKPHYYPQPGYKKLSHLCQPRSPA